MKIPRALCKTKLLFNNRGRVVTHHYVPLVIISYNNHFTHFTLVQRISTNKRVIRNISYWFESCYPEVLLFLWNILIMCREDSTKGERRSRRSVSPAKWKQFKIFTDPDGPVKIQPHYAAELLHIFRPLIYRMLMISWYIYINTECDVVAGMYWWGKKSWKAWLVSLFADITSLRHYAKNVRMLTPAGKITIQLMSWL